MARRLDEEREREREREREEGTATDGQARKAAPSNKAVFMGFCRPERHAAPSPTAVATAVATAARCRRGRVRGTPVPPALEAGLGTAAPGRGVGSLVAEELALVVARRIRDECREVTELPRMPGSFYRARATWASSLPLGAFDELNGSFYLAAAPHFSLR
jgi:hypothetical protein